MIFVDTSASQTGVFKKDSIATLKHLMAGLTRDDRVKLVAMDIDPVDLTSGFVRVDSPEIANALAKLENRVALGSTDIGAMVDSTVNQFTNDSKRNRNVIYIGDASAVMVSLTTANLLRLFRRWPRIIFHFRVMPLVLSGISS